MGEAYRRQDYRVIENDNAGSDSGIALVIRKDGKSYLVQCKQWRSQKVGVKGVREMFGLVKERGFHPCSLRNNYLVPMNV